MDYRTLKELVKQGEGKQLEFKLKSNHPEKIVREIVAFANSEGGRLLIGVGDDKSIKGLKYADEDEYILVRAIEKYITPTLPYTLETVPVGDERNVLIFTILPSPHKPHYLLQEVELLPQNNNAQKKQNNSTKIVRKAYVRVADKSVQASWEMREILRRGRNNRDIKFTYGEKEQKLIRHLGENRSVTVETFAKIANISKNLASKTLILLVLANVLEVHPDEIMDSFTMLQRF